MKILFVWLLLVFKRVEYGYGLFFRYDMYWDDCRFYL